MENVNRNGQWQQAKWGCVSPVTCCVIAAAVAAASAVVVSTHVLLQQQQPHPIQTLLGQQIRETRNALTTCHGKVFQSNIACDAFKAEQDSWKSLSVKKLAPRGEIFLTRFVKDAVVVKQILRMCGGLKADQLQTDRVWKC